MWTENRKAMDTPKPGRQHVWNLLDLLKTPGKITLMMFFLWENNQNHLKQTQDLWTITEEKAGAPLRPVLPVSLGENSLGSTPVPAVRSVRLLLMSCRLRISPSQNSAFLFAPGVSFGYVFLVYTWSAKKWPLKKMKKCPICIDYTVVWHLTRLLILQTCGCQCWSNSHKSIKHDN